MLVILVFDNVLKKWSGNIKGFFCLFVLFLYGVSKGIPVILIAKGREICLFQLMPCIISIITGEKKHYLLTEINLIEVIALQGFLCGFEFSLFVCLFSSYFILFFLIFLFWNVRQFILY